MQSLIGARSRARGKVCGDSFSRFHCRDDEQVIGCPSAIQRKKTLDSHDSGKSQSDYAEQKKPGKKEFLSPFILKKSRKYGLSIVMACVW